MIESNIVGAFWIAALVTWLFHAYIDPFTYFGKIGPAVFLTLPMLWCGTFDCHAGWPRQVSGAISSVMTIAAMLGLIFLGIDLKTAFHCLRFYIYGLPIVLFIYQYLTQVQPKK